MKSVRVETEDNYYDFTCDEEFIGGYDNRPQGMVRL